MITLLLVYTVFGTLPAAFLHARLIKQARVAREATWLQHFTDLVASGNALRLDLYDVLGRHSSRIVRPPALPTADELNVSPGVYLAVLQSASGISTIKLTIR